MSDSNSSQPDSTEDSFNGIPFERIIWPFVAAVALIGYFFQPLLKYADPLFATYVGLSFALTVIASYIYFFFFRNKYLSVFCTLTVFLFGATSGMAAYTVKFNIISQQNLCEKLYSQMTTMKGDYDKAATTYNSLSCLNPGFNSFREHLLGGVE